MWILIEDIIQSEKISDALLLVVDAVLPRRLQGVIEYVAKWTICELRVTGRAIENLLLLDGVHFLCVCCCCPSFGSSFGFCLLMLPLFS